MIQFTFRGRRSYDDFGVVMQSKDRTVLPEKRRRQIEIPGRHGQYDFEGSVYDDRMITLSCFLDGAGFTDFRERVRQVAYWLCEPGLLTFDDEPSLSYHARIYSAIPLEQALSAGLFTLSFECYPLAGGAEKTVSDSMEQKGQWMNAEYTGTAEAGARFVLVNTGTSAVVHPSLLVVRRNV